MSVELVKKSAAKSNEKLVNQKYATLFLSWMPFKKYNDISFVYVFGHKGLDHLAPGFWDFDSFLGSS